MIVFANLLHAAASVLGMLVTFYIWVLVIRMLLSWVNPDPYNPIVRFLCSVTDPAIYWVRRKLPRMGGPIDWASFVLLLGLLFLQYFVVQTMQDYAYVLRMAALRQ